MNKYDLILDLRKEKLTTQRLINTILEVEIYRVTKQGKDTQYRLEQARLYSILYPEFSRKDIDKLIKEELLKLIKRYDIEVFDGIEEESNDYLVRYLIKE